MRVKNPTQKKLRRHCNSTSRFENYERLKSELTASARNAFEYQAACQRAAKLAGV